MLLAEVSATATEYKGEKVSPNETKTKNVHLTLWASIQEFVDMAWYIQNYVQKKTIYFVFTK